MIDKPFTIEIVDVAQEISGSSAACRGTGFAPETLALYDTCSLAEFLVTMQLIWSRHCNERDEASEGTTALQKKYHYIDIVYSQIVEYVCSHFTAEQRLEFAKEIVQNLPKTILIEDGFDPHDFISKLDDALEDAVEVLRVSDSGESDYE